MRTQKLSHHHRSARYSKLQKKRRICQISILFLLCVIATIGAAVYLYPEWSKRSQSLDSENLKNAPAFQLPDATGHLHELKELQGEVLLIHFWASWCGPCLSEIPEWVELATHFKDRPLRLVAISTDRTWEDAQKILPTQKLTSRVLSLLDASLETSELYGTFQFPETYLISRDQKILMKWVGPQDWKNKRVLKLIERALAEH